MKTKLAIALASTLFVTAVQAQAQTQTFTPAFYGGAELGYSQMKNFDDSSVSQIVSIAGGTADVSQKRGVFSGRIFGGYKALENLDLELGYFQSGAASQNFNGVTGDGVAYSGSQSRKVSGFDYSVLLRPSISTGFNGAFLRLGGHYSKVKQHTEISSVDAAASASANQSGNGVMAGLGYDFSVAKNMDVRAEYNHMESVGGRSDTPVNTFRIGVVGKF
ncbi:hypothetical protein D9O50_01080 [Oxalobacteraceae bacterium CAVE-383]|nr:hypothetical protein D9O50_01080 [Oxalobacteraceae bacterium CAVE-383]